MCVAKLGPSGLAVEIIAGGYALRADEPVESGGTETGPTPYDLLCSAACTSITCKLYADRQGYPLQGLTVEVKHENVAAADCAGCNTMTGKVDVVHRMFTLEGPLDAAAREDLMRIANRCPLHRTLTGEIKIRTAAMQRSSP